MDDLSLYQLASSCMFVIIQFQRHYTRDKRNDNFILLYFFYQVTLTLFMCYARKINNYTGDYERHNKFA